MVVDFNTVLFSPVFFDVLIPTGTVAVSMVMIWLFFVVILVVCFCFIKYFERSYDSNDRAGKLFAIDERLFKCFTDFFLGVTVIENR